MCQVTSISSRVVTRIKFREPIQIGARRASFVADNNAGEGIPNMPLCWPLEKCILIADS